MATTLFTSLKDKLQRDRSETEIILENIYLFKNLTRRERKYVEQLAHLRRYAPQEKIFSQGDPGSGMYIIIQGTIGIFQEIAGQEPNLLGKLTKGDFFGELALLDEAPRSASAVALEKSVLLGFFRADLMKLIQTKPATGNKILLALAGVLAVRLRETDERLAEVTRMNNSRGAADSQ